MEVITLILNGEMTTTETVEMFIPAKVVGMFGRMAMTKQPKAPNNCFNLTMAIYAIDPDHVRKDKVESVIPVLTAMTRPLQVKQMLDGCFSRVTSYADTRQATGEITGGNKCRGFV